MGMVARPTFWLMLALIPMPTLRRMWRLITSVGTSLPWWYSKVGANDRLWKLQ